MTKHLLLVAFLWTSFALVTAAQDITFSGHVIDARTQESLIGATLLGTSGKGTATDASGNFSIQAPEGEVFTVSSIGYETQKVTATPNNITIALPISAASLDAVVVVGTRSLNRTALNTPVPIDIISMRDVAPALPQYDLNQMLTYLAPSFQSNRQSSSDGTEHIDPASLRGMGPDQTLVLINGKRRHTTSLLNNQGTFGNGSVGTDLNAIPASAIDRIEVLRDGASAQYGSDAIAGVINIILKKDTEGLSFTAMGGGTQAGDGAMARLSANYGLEVGNNGGSIQLSGDAYVRDRTNRTQHHDLIIFDQSALGNFFAYPFTDNPDAARAYDDSVLVARGLTRDDFNFQVGDAKIVNLGLFYNLNLPLRSQKGAFYSFGGSNLRKGEGYGFRRLPSDGNKMVLSKFPNGFQPNTVSDIYDFSVAAGFEHEFGAWHFDISNVLGNNTFNYTVRNTVNASLQDATPTDFDAGGHRFMQNTLNADLSRHFGNVLKGLNLGLGAEFRYEGYHITAGEEASWRNYGLVILPDGTVEDQLGLAGGAQSFPGFSPDNAVNASRNSQSAYTDVELDLNKSWSIGAAGRFERYSDFGSTFNYKFATKYNIGGKVVLRGAYSTGFRAPSLHQQYFSYVSTTILSDGRLGQSGFFRNNSDLAQALEIPKLNQETAKNLSLGLTYKPNNRFNLSIDAYRIRVDDRIVLTGLFGYDPFGSPIPELQALLLPYGADAARFFTNAINTTTRGLDVVASYKVLLGKSRLEISALANFNETKADSILNIPVQLEGQEDIYFSPAERGLIERVNPRQKFNLIVNYSIGKFNAVLSNVYFGKSYRNGFPFGVEQTFSGKLVTDLSLSYRFNHNLSLTIGANNLLNVYPDLQAYENSYFGVFKYAPVQMGMDGAFYFARLRVDLGKEKINTAVLNN